MTFMSDPSQNALFWPLIIRLAIVLIPLLVVLLVIAMRQGGALSEDILLKRWRTWLVISVVLVAGLFSGSFVFASLVSVIIAQGLREYASLVQLPKLYRNVLITMGIAMPFAALISADLFYLAAPVFLILATLQPLVTFPANKGAVRDLAFAVLGWGYIAWFLAHLVMIYNFIDGGPGLLIVMLTSVALSDVGAYIAGRTFGKAKLAPMISPNKTWAGAVGNLVGACFAVIVMRFALPADISLVFLIVLPLMIAMGSLWGDLVESVLKREFEVKDAGTWLPGFGGLLDRVDSLILVAPLTYYLARFVT